jgi:hypothetical protein
LSLDGKVLGMLGTTGRESKEFGWIHELACPSENAIFAAELLNWRRSAAEIARRARRAAA